MANESPKIYTKNYVSADCVITVSHADAVKGYLYDRDPKSKWISSGANNDATQISIEVQFYEGASAVSRTIDTLFLLNHNLKTWNLDYWTGSVWTTLTSQAADAQANRVASFGSVTTSKVRILATATQTVNAEKFIGELMVAALQVTIGQDMVSYEPQMREKVKEIMLGDGSIHRAVVRHSQNRTQKYGARVRLLYVTQAIADSLLTIKEAGDPFLWQPEPTARAEEVYLVYWSGPFYPHYVSSYKGANYEIDLSLKEV